MSFNDEDLKQLKSTGTFGFQIGWKEIQALVARLEAAERCARYLDAIYESERSPIENDALNEWRKAKGE
jgi:hypothetical protein